MEVIACGIHGFAETIGIDVDEFRVFWKLAFEREDTKQTHYRVRISSDPKAEAEEQTCFDSGKTAGGQQRNIPCKPEGGFKSTTSYYWTVQIWDQNGNTAVSRVNQFYTSYPRCSRLLPPYSMNQTYVSISST